MTHIAFSGNMTAPVELRFTQNGKAVASVTVAVNRKRGEVEETDFHRVTLWDSLAEHAANLDKGTRVVVIGRLAQRPWETKDGEKRTSWEVAADSFGPDLRWATVALTRTQSQGGAGRGSNGPVEEPRAPSNPAPATSADDVWNTPTSYSDETPF